MSPLETPTAVVDGDRAPMSPKAVADAEEGIDGSVALSLDEARALSMRVLCGHGFSLRHAEAITANILACERDECRSHGLYRLLVCVRTARTGRVDLHAEPEVFDQAPGVVRVDAKRGYSLLAFEAGRSELAKKAQRSGIAALAINNCFHFSALWPEVEALARDGLAALAMTPSHAWVAPAGGTKPVFGTNPIAFAWPRPGGEPFIFDFATSTVARGEIELHRRADRPIPLGWALDADGGPTTDPAAGLAGAMTTFGTHKGSALSAMIELMAGPLIGDMLSLESKAWDGGADATPLHGELILAFDPAVFGGPSTAANSSRAELLFQAIVSQDARLPSQRRVEARARTARRGSVLIPHRLHADLLAHA